MWRNTLVNQTLRSQRDQENKCASWDLKAFRSHDVEGRASWRGQRWVVNEGKVRLKVDGGQRCGGSWQTWTWSSLCRSGRPSLLAGSALVLLIPLLLWVFLLWSFYFLQTLFAAWHFRERNGRGVTERRLTEEEGRVQRLGLRSLIDSS